MHSELKRAIVNWLIDHEGEWQRVNACHDAFGQYIYDAAGNHIIGGEEVSAFIIAADKLLFAENL